MKKVKLLLLMATVAVGTVVFQGCGDDEPVDKLPPVMNFLGGVEYISTDVTIGVETKFKIGVTVTHDSKMNNFKVTLSTDNGPALVYLDSSINAENLTYTLMDSAAKTVNVTKKYTFTATDKDGLSTTKSITVTSKSVDLREYTTDVSGNPFKVWHIKGPNLGAFDLLLGNNLTTSDPNAEKDIADSTASSEVTDWPARWACLNSTVFKKVASTTKYGSVTTPAGLQTVWNNSGAELKVYKGIKKDDVFIFKLVRGGNKLVLVGITDVVKTSGDNKDYVQFLFKKED